MLAQRLQGLLPALDPEEALEVTRIHGVAGSLRGAVAAERPFRAPHHTASVAGLLGGGSPPRPGEISLAHRGVLFLDELPEFERRALESLRQVLEERHVVVARAGATCVFPADFQLVAAMNPCPCGWRGAPQRDCRCDDAAVARYAARISGPLLDRIDLHVPVMPVAWHALAAPVGPEGSTAAARERVAAARARQSRPTTSCNARLRDSELDEAAQPTPEASTLLGRAVERLGLSARAARRALRVARSIADLGGESRVEAPAMAEALSFRDDSPRTS
jgi:magnesium chelatase family protein